jgi:hypothetical protein
VIPVPGVSWKLIGGLLAVLTLYLAVAAGISRVDSKGYERGKAEGDAKYNRLVAQHATTVAVAVEAARVEEQAIASKFREQEQAIARQVEARASARLAQTNAQLRSLRDAANADPDFARCLALPLPDGMRVEPNNP